MWFTLTEADINRLIACTKTAIPRGHDEAEARTELATKLETQLADRTNPDFPAWVDAARRIHDEVDDDAVVSPSEDDGAYVMAWVWVSDIDMKGKVS